MADRFSTHAATFFTAVLGPLADYAKTNADAIKAQTKENIVTAFAAVIGVPSAQPQSFASLSPTLPLALSGGALPAGLAAGLGVNTGAAPAKKGRSTGSGGKAAMALQRWITLDVYRHDSAKGAKLCAYLPNRGEHKGNVCAGPTANPDAADPLDYRCTCCGTKQGEIKKKITGATVGMAPRVAPGFNIPLVASSAIPPMPLFGNLPMPGGLPSLGNIPALPSAGLPPSLPSGLPPLNTLPAPGGIPTLPGVPPLPLGLPSGTAPPSLPVAGGLPLPGALPVAEEESGIKVFENVKLTKVYWPSDVKYSQLAIKAQGEEDLVCIGKVSGFTPTLEGDIPSTWSETLTAPTKEDFAYLKSFGILYNFENAGTATSIA